MSAMGILFLVSAAIIGIRNIVLYIIEASAGTIEDPFKLFLDNFVNSSVTNEKFMIAMIAGGGFLLYWGFFKRKEEFGPPDKQDWRRSYR